MASEVPLLNSYKTGFVRRRLLHTLTGRVQYFAENAVTGLKKKWHWHCVKAKY